jgi:ubiquinone/menaquinone biosynthesis C-methylase UbiE
MSNANYVDVIYNLSSKPFTNYRAKLINYLIKKYKLVKNSSLLELGCGRGEFLKEFIDQGMIGYGVDISDYAKSYYKDGKILLCDLSKQKLPFSDNFFDIIYSKSFIEHFYYPEVIFEEAYRVLKPSSIIITPTSEWNYIYKSFYEDYSHRTPSTKISLQDIHLITNFNNVKVESFKQLPILWKKSYYIYIIKLLSFLTRVLMPDYFRLKIKWIRFSKEIMLLSSGYK